jgi:phosphate transport system substrate-binding protein
MAKQQTTLLLLALPALLVLTFELPAQVPGSMPDPLEQSRQIDEELKKLDQTPVGQKVAQMEGTFEDGMHQIAKAREALRTEYLKLEKTAVYDEYTKRRRQLQSQRADKWTIERKAMAEAAEKLYAARHAELKKLAPGDTPKARQLGLDVLTYPRVDGSTSAHPLSVILACRVLGAPYQWVYPEPTGSPYRVRPNLETDLFLFDEWDYLPDADSMEFSLAASRVVAQPPQAGQARLAVMINSLLAISTSTHSAYTNLVEGKCDLNLTARPPTEDELALAGRRGIKIALRPIARDALVFIVNYKNPVTTISREQVRRIYQGKIKHWAELGGGTNDIVALWREHNSGSRELFDQLLTQDQPIPEPQFNRELFSNSMAGPFNQVTQAPNALGYSVFYYEHHMALSPYTRMPAIDGVEPSSATIGSGTYPLTTAVYVAFRAGESTNSPAMKLLNWLISPEGQAVVRETGYVPAR